LKREVKSGVRFSFVNIGSVLVAGAVRLEPYVETMMNRGLFTPPEWRALRVQQGGARRLWGSKVEGDNAAWSNLRRNPERRSPFFPVLRQSSLADAGMRRSSLLDLKKWARRRVV
jgi:hypothetical protein